jgi:cytochrome oxidase assembly protein ShyY1
VHVGVAALATLMVNLAFWQAHRLEERQEFNATVTARSAVGLAPLPRLATQASTDPDSVEWRRVMVSGTYEPGDAVTIVNRSSNGTAGYNQVVPFRADGVGTVLVNRGFVPLGTEPDARIPDGPLEVAGYLRVSQTRGTLGAVDSTEPGTVEFQRIDIPLISRSIGVDMFPMYLQLIAESPSPGGTWPAPVAFPELSEGSHRSYVFQWAFFSLVAAAAWVVVVRRKWRAGVPVSGTPGQTSA